MTCSDDRESLERGHGRGHGHENADRERRRREHPHDGNNRSERVGAVRDGGSPRRPADTLERQSPIVPTFRPVDERPGVLVVDPVEHKRYSLKTSAPVTFRASDLEDFYFPVDAATAFSTASLLLPYVVPTVVRDRDGDMLLEVEHNAYETLPEGEYLLELMAPIRLYVRFRGSVTIASSDERLAFAFGEETLVHLGARSHHERPAATVTTTAEPEDLARAVSTFGSALKTLSCERSLPTFRGHPPRIELGSDLEIPPGISPPETGVRIVVPPRRTAVYAVSSLAYYLGATVETGDDPRIETDRGFVYPLGQPGEAFERSLERVLKHVFFFDCVTRTEGFYRIDLHERRGIDARVDLAFDELYDRALAEQLETYLSVPFDAVSDVFPTWKLVTHTTPDPENATVLPFLANELSIVETVSTQRTGSDDPPSIDLDVLTRSMDQFDDPSSRQLSVDSLVSPPDADAFEQAWLGDGVPIGANKLLREGFENGLETSASGDSIEITIVCNDSRMLEEVDGPLYGDRDELPFDIAVYRDLSVDELRERFAADTDFLHYIGHVENGAFVCSDGHLEADSLTEVGVDTFLLNGCLSYEIGVQLIEAGSVGGIVTLSEVGNPDAIAVGRLVARLLNTGFTLRSAVDVARSYRLVGAQYVVVGDGGASVTQSGGGVPNVCRVEPMGDGDGGPGGTGPGENYRVRLRLYHCSQAGMGALYIPYIDGIDRYFLVGGDLPTLSLPGPVLSRFFRLEQIPVEFDGEWYWSMDDRFSDL